MTWLPKQLGVSLKELAATAQAGTGLPAPAQDLEQSLANFLAGQSKKTSEDRRAWVMNQDGDVRTAWLNLDNIVSSAFDEDDRFCDLYDLASAVLHGRLGRGLELMLDPKGSCQRARWLGFLVLERLCTLDEEFAPLAAALFQSSQLFHAANLGGPEAAASDRIARQMFGDLSDTLRVGTDYVGRGSQEDPFVINDHLEFYQAQNALLKQLGLDPSKLHRVTEHDGMGRQFDRWITPSQDYWFLVRRPFLGVEDWPE